MRTRYALAFVLGVGVIALTAAIGCGSNTTGASCGAGTSLVGGVCVATGDASVADGAAEPGDDAASGSDADGAAPSNRCPSEHAPKMIELPGPQGSTFCMDATEVTNAQFREFQVATMGRYPNTNLSCSNGYYPPDPNTPTCHYDPVNAPNLPVTCVDWCAAWSYCAWAGKRLCGNLEGGSVDPAQASNPAIDMWTRACSSAAKYAYTTGDSGAGVAVCNVYQGPNTQSEPRAVTANPDCHSPDSPWAGVLDLNGNAAEWEDACDAGACNVRGGYYADSFLNIQCAKAVSKDARDRNDGNGIRCCAN